MRLRRWLPIVGVVLLMVGGLALLLYAPLGTRDLVSLPRPAADYPEALNRLAVLQATDTSTVNPDCRTQLLTHGRKVAKAIVLLHGYTNCPQQFLTLGQQLHAQGHNVLIPRFSFHGYADRMTDAQGQLTALHLTMLTDEVVDIGRGLGDDVTLVGLSIGGTMAAWAAQHRTDLDRAVVMAPLFGLKALPWIVHAPVANACYVVPNLFVWWDASLREQTTPAYAYPRFATRGIGAVLRLSDAVWQSATQQPPGARSIVVITSPGDEAIDNQAATSMANAWQARSPNAIETHQLPDNLGLRHDFIDPNQPYQKVAVVYPLLIPLIVGPAA